MSIQFKFRSCLNFDSVDVDGRPSISLRELRKKIMRHKKLSICQEFDLIFSDALSGKEYNDENVQIASGSSVIVKRVPAGTMPSAAKPSIGTMKDLGLKDADPVNHVVGQANVFDDFGNDICPVAEGTFLGSDIGYGNKNCRDFEKENLSGPRVVRSNFPAVPGSGLRVELQCPLCNNFLKDAVLIPCCQHSFCEKCIRLALLEKAMCPKCLSIRCRVEDLLPNLSLRQAIEHFLESQMVVAESENALRRYAPDGESGIHVRDVCCAVTVVQREPEMPQSPSATGEGSNQVMAESLNDSLIRKKALARTMQQMDGGRGRYANHWNFPSVTDDPEDCQGESNPINCLYSHVQDEGGDMNFVPAGRVKKDRNCYMCGSPDHLIRDCAFASYPNPMLQTGNAMLTGGFPRYPSPYWNCNTYSTMRPFANMYGNAGNAPFNACMVPPTPFAPPYMRSMHSSVALPGGIMGMGGMALPAGNRDDLPLKQYEYMGLQLDEDKRRIQHEKMRRGQYCQAESNFKEPSLKNDREASGKVHKEREPSTSCSGDGFARKTHRKHLRVEKRRERSPHSSSDYRDKVRRHSDRSNSVTDGFPSSSDRRRRESHQHHSRDSRKDHECDSTLDHYQVSDRKRGVNCHVRGSHQKHHRSSALEPSAPVHQKARSKERGLGHDARNSRHHERHSIDEVRDNKKRMSSGSYEDCRDSYHHKRKRVH
ncbi:E3 ubiquitin ligase PARAQUAT TOLERANCE 3-like isoform X2 [Lycium barbarum]|uniref:E3 ubiquitin ligase PARAQUAT TOLERANCE 3-like isoform X2 n=1 Tax=Lycium barbarum TaxID=112863 RepID=UPI00293F5978|nr:E3 ubiquitin ligase PARAQUAT TOLERANCE 3-like isoform X2 [Lycium barbarum]